MRNGWISALAISLGTSTISTTPLAQATDLSRQYLTDTHTQLLYHFNETSGSVARDSSGKGLISSTSRDASYNAVSLGQDSMSFFDSAFSAGDGLTERVTWTAPGGTSSFLYPAANQSFTIEGWFKLSTDTFERPSALFTVQPSGNANPDYQLILMASNHATRASGLVFRDTNKYLAYTGPLEWCENAWYHIAIVVTQGASTSQYTLYRTKQSGATEVLDDRSGNFLMLPLASDSANRVFSVGNFYGDNGHDYFPGLIDEVRFSTSARTPTDFRLTLAPTVTDKIRTEGTAANSETDHALPLAGSWNDGAHGYEQGNRNADPTHLGFSPLWQKEQIENGHYLLPWFTTPSPNAPTLATKLIAFNPSNDDDYSFSDYYSSAMVFARTHGLPISFLNTWASSGYYNQWEHKLHSASAYLEAPTETNPNFVCAVGSTVCVPGTPIARLSPFGYIDVWGDMGTEWGASTLLADLQALYPQPPKVLFISNNEGQKVVWAPNSPPGTCSASANDKCAIVDDQHYLDHSGYNPSDSSNTKIKKTMEGWADRYQRLREYWKAELTGNWQQASQFIGFNAFGPDNYGREAAWQSKALAYELGGSDRRIVPAPNEWDGTSVQQYVSAPGNGWEGTVSDDRVRGITSESMNQVFMLKEAIANNADYWFELSTWNGCEFFDSNRNPTCWSTLPPPFTSAIYTAARYAGSTQFSMWVLRPRLVREFRNHARVAATVADYFNAVIASVDKVHNNPVLYSFWRNSELVSTETEDYAHPYFKNQLAAYAGAERMFLLQTSLSPDEDSTEDWTMNTEVPVSAIARVQGEPGHRKWLIYAFSPNGSESNVDVLIPGYATNDGTITIHVEPGGVFYLVDEETDDVEEIL